MTQTDEAESLDASAPYNDVAIKYARLLHQARTVNHRGTRSKQRRIEDLFPPHNRSGAGVALEYERMGNTPVSPELQQRADHLDIELEHIGLTLGTVIHNIDLRRTLSPQLVKFVRDTLLERKVVFFRDQHLSEDQQVSFARNFGELDAFPFGKPGANPYILEIGHGQDNPGTENSWHTDVTWMEQPSLGSVAQCIEVPPCGGDTLFSDSHACFFGLPAEMQERLEHIHGVNDYRVFLMPRGSQSLPDDLIDNIKRDIPFGVSHPLLRTHPETGKTSLYIHGGFLRHDSLFDVRTGESLGPAESKEIVRFLLHQHEKPEYLCRFKWSPGSFAFWDNRAVQHYAASDYYPHKRLLRRVTVSGDKPYYDSTRA